MNSPNSQTERLDQDLRLLRVFNYYRLILSCALVFTYFNEAGKAFIGLDHPVLFIFTSTVYFLFNLSLAVVLGRNISLQRQQIIFNVLVDITALTLLAYASGGVNSGISNLVVFSVAAGSILMLGSYATLFAAIASILTIASEVYHSAVVPGSSQHYFQAGVLGMVYFATAFFIRNISRRVHTSETLAKQRATDIVHLEKLNKLIIQRMRTGIIVCDQNGQIKLLNEAAVRLLGDHKRADNSMVQIRQLPSPLLKRFEDWRINPQRRSSPFRTFPDNPEVQANFTSLRQQEYADVLIFLEDNSKAMQQAQQLKLASLGQLTANIAHEIRNPLGAVSHAAQLLGESPGLDQADQRLANIVQENSVRMNSTIENILELSRRRQPEPEPIILKSWLEEFVDQYQVPEQGTGADRIDIRIGVFPENLRIHTDPSHLAQVLTNLCDNGRRYAARSGASPELQLNAGIREQDELPYLDVIDNGPGISSDVAARLFEPFYTTEHTGTGLGLYISRELCEANNARLDHLASHTPGCCFRVIFPHPKKLMA